MNYSTVYSTCPISCKKKVTHSAICSSVPESEILLSLEYGIGSLNILTLALERWRRKRERVMDDSWYVFL